jgi:hypothetical protein
LSGWPLACAVSWLKHHISYTSLQSRFIMNRIRRNRDGA